MTIIAFIEKIVKKMFSSIKNPAAKAKGWNERSQVKR